MELQRSREPLWCTVLDGVHVCEVRHIDTDTYVLAIFNDETGECLHTEPTDVSFEPAYGAHVRDVVRWQTRAQELIESPDPPWNRMEDEA